jgi:ribosomal protein S25
MELWKPHPLHALDVSSEGSVRKAGTAFVYKPHLYKYPNSGYVIVTVPHPRKKGRLSVARLVCETFFGPPTFGAGSATHAAHLNGNSLDNRAENLKWVSPKENIGHKKAHGTCHVGEAHHNATTRNSSVEALIREWVSDTTVSKSALAAKHGMNGPVAFAILEKRNWKWMWAKLEAEGVA